MSFSAISFTDASFTIYAPSTWVVPVLQRDFDTDIEDLIIPYIETQWLLSDPSQTTVKFRPGLFDYSVPYEACALQTTTRASKETNGQYTFVTDIPISMRAKRLTTDEDPTRPLYL